MFAGWSPMKLRRNLCKSLALSNESDVARDCPGFARALNMSVSVLTDLRPSS